MTSVMNIQSPLVFTIGHSTHPIDQFIALLKQHGVEALADVRTYPGSGRNPQFNQEPLKRSLNDSGITYYHMVSLGGRRKRPKPADPEKFSHAGPFAAYIDYTKTESFQTGLSALEDLASKTTTAIMCAEALWRNCHRQFIAQAMEIHGFAVTHITDKANRQDIDRSPTIPGL